MVPQQHEGRGATAWAAPRTQVIWKVVLPTALPGILTGVMLAVARAAGETAPLLFTALFSNYWLFEAGLALMQPTASLAVLIYNFSGMPFENQIELAWAASLVLVLIVLAFNIVSRLIGAAPGLSAGRDRMGRHDRAATTDGNARQRRRPRHADVGDRLQRRPDLLRQLPGRARQPRRRSRRARSPASSARRAAARARCCAASTA